MKLFIYKISQTENKGWDIFDSAVVIASNEFEASNMIPSFSSSDFYKYDFSSNFDAGSYSWATKRENVKVELLGKADNKEKFARFVVASFNAG